MCAACQSLCNHIKPCVTFNNNNSFSLYKSSYLFFFSSLCFVLIEGLFLFIKMPQSSISWVIDDLFHGLFPTGVWWHFLKLKKKSHPNFVTLISKDKRIIWCDRVNRLGRYFLKSVHWSLQFSTDKNMNEQTLSLSSILKASIASFFVLNVIGSGFLFSGSSATSLY